MREYILKYKKDILAFSFVSGLFFIFLVLCWGRFGDIIVDCGREAYLPQLILEGKVLYKEIFAMYNPLSYQINALLYLMFGASFNTLYFAGIFSTFLILFAIYLISRQLLSPFKAIFPALITICFCICKHPNCVDYIFPYSYGMIYSLVTFLYFVLFSIYFVKKIEDTVPIEFSKNCNDLDFYAPFLEQSSSLSLPKHSKMYCPYLKKIETPSWVKPEVLYVSQDFDISQLSEDWKDSVKRYTTQQIQEIELAKKELLAYIDINPELSDASLNCPKPDSVPQKKWDDLIKLKNKLMALLRGENVRQITVLQMQ